MSVPDPRKRPGNVACESRRVKPKGSLNHPGEPGEGKTGRVNANEPPLRLRYERSSQPMAAATMTRPGTRPHPWSGKDMPPLACRDTRAAQYGRHPPPSCLSWCGTWQPRRGLAAGPKPDDLRKDGPTPQREQDGPRSERHRPKGKGKTRKITH